MSAKNRILSEEEMEEQKEYTERVGRISAEFEQTHGRKPRFFSATYGCQQNENDTERLDGMLLQMGYEYTEDKDLADLILFNTCAVREHAETKVETNLAFSGASDFGKQTEIFVFKRLTENIARGAKPRF